MNFDFSSEQLQIKDGVSKLLARCCPPAAVRRVLDGHEPFARDTWTALAHSGYLGAGISAEHGGVGAGPLELCVIAEELGAALAPVPFLSSIGLCAELIRQAASEAQQRQWLPQLASGESIGCFALVEAPGRIAPDQIAAQVTNGRLTGSKLAVLDGDVADVALVAAQSAGAIRLFRVDLNASGVRREPLSTIDPSRGQVRLVFESVAAEPLPAGDWAAIESALDRAAVLLAFEQIGGAAKALDMARAYARERFAFGRPIGSFQALQHKLVDMYVALVLARSNSYYAAWAMAHDADALPGAAAAARISASQAYQLCARENIQVHGGSGFSWDLDCHLHYRRAHLLAVCLGGTTQWQDRLIDAMLAQRHHSARVLP